MSTRSLTIRCIELGIFGDVLWDMQIRACEPVVREALKERDAAGLPFAGQTVRSDDEGRIMWAQREFWDRDDCDFNIQAGVDGIVADHRSLIMLVDWRVERWGSDDLPTIPRLEW